MSVRSSTDPRAKDNIPDIVIDKTRGKKYKKGRFLGKVKILNSESEWDSKMWIALFASLINRSFLNCFVI